MLSMRGVKGWVGMDRGEQSRSPMVRYRMDAAKWAWPRTIRACMCGERSNFCMYMSLVSH